VRFDGCHACATRNLEENIVAEIPEQTLIEMLAPRPGERVLDAGCGLGRWSAALAATGAHVTGIDIQAPLLEQARLACPGAEFVSADLLRWSPGQPFDAIYAFATLHWVLPPQAAASAMHALLRPGGRLGAAFGGLNPAARGLAGCYLPDVNEYAGVLLAAGFAILDVRRCVRHFLVLAERPDGRPRPAMENRDD
jgi:SAM-dependent methyltransferase